MAVKRESFQATMTADTAGFVAGTAAAEKSAKSLETQTERTINKTNNYSREMQRLVRAIDPAADAQVRLSRGMETLRRALDRPLDKGGITPERHAELVTALNNKYGQLAQTLHTSRRGMEVYGDATKLTRFQMLTMQYTISDAIASLASGANIFTIMMQQGGQVTQAFGGVGATFRALLTPARLLGLGFLGAAAGVAALGSAANKHDSSLRSLRVLVEATGRGAVLSKQQIEQYVVKISELSKVSRSEAETSARSLLASRAIHQDSFGKMIKLAGDFAAVTGTTVPNAMAELVNGSKNVSSFANEMHNRFGILTLEQYKQIAAWEKQGEVQKAYEMVVDSLAKKLDGARANSITPLGDAIDKLGTAWEKVTRAFSEAPWVESVVSATAKAVEALAPLVKVVGFLVSNPTFGSYQAERAANPWKYAPTEFDAAAQGPTKALSGTGDLSKTAAAQAEAGREQDRAFKKLIDDLTQEQKAREDARTSLNRQIESYEKSRIELTQGAKAAYVYQELLKAEPELMKLSAQEQERYKQKISATAEAYYDYRQKVLEAKKEQEELSAAIKATAGKLSNTLAEAFIQGKSSMESFRLFYIQMVEQLIAKTLQLKIIEPIFDSIMGVGKSAGGGSSWISDIGSSLFSVLASGGGMASGGSVYAGHSYTVGEHGPEKIVMGSSGRVVPSSAVASSTPLNFNFNVNVDGPAAGDPATAQASGAAFAMAAEAAIVKILEKHKRFGGVLYT